MQNFNVDISTSHIPQALYVKQGDSLSRFFALTIADNGSPWEPPENAAYTIRFSTSAGTGWYDIIQLVGGTTRPAVSAAGNVLTCEVAEQATLGNGQLCVMVNDATGYQLGTWNLNIIAEVVPGANSQEAESYYGVLAGQIAQALAAEQGATEQANLAKQYADSIDPSQFATQAELDATQAELAAKTTGHIIQNPDGTAMPQRAALQFVGFKVNDDPSGKTVVSPKTAGDTKNVAGYVGEISLFADNQLRENHVWADGSTINPATWPDLAAYAATAGWETDSGTGWYKTPNLQGCFLLPSSSEHAVNTTGGEATHTLTVDEMPAHSHAFQNPMLAFTSDPPSGQSTVQLSGTSSGAGWIGTDAIGEQATASTGGGQPHNNMPPYYVVTAQIRAKVDIIEATAVEVNGNTMGGFEDGQVLAQQGGKLVGQPGAIKTFVGVGNLGLASGSVTTAQVFDAMPEGSTALINSTNVSDPPDPYGLIIVHKISSASGQATFYRAGNSAVAKTQQMYIKQGGGGLSGVWAATSTVLSTSIVSIKSSGMVEANGSAEASVSFPAVSGASAYVAIPQACNFGIITALSVSGTNVTCTIMNLSGDSHTLNAKVLIMALG